MSLLFRDRCRCGNCGILPGGKTCPDFPACWIEDIIARRRGRAQAIAIAEIQTITRRPEREIKQSVHDLRMQGVRIGSCRMSSAHGYYMIETEQELRDFLRSYFRQAMTELRVIQKMLGKDYHQVADLAGQLEFDLGGNGG